MQLDNQKIKEILIRESFITEDDIVNAERNANAESVPLVDYILKHELLSKLLLGQAIAEYYQVPYMDLETKQPAREVIEHLSEEIAQKYHVVLVQMDTENMVFATDQPYNKDLFALLQTQFPDKQMHLVFSFLDSISALFVYYQKPLATRFSEIIKQKNKVAPEIINEIVKDANLLRASDIHFEPQKTEVIIRFRTDGLLREVGRMPKELYANILNRIKVQCGMQIDDHFSAQDGAIRYEEGSLAIDMRVSVIPTLEGEKIVIRLLSEYLKNFSFSELGLNAQDYLRVEQAARKPFGMVLVVGPTGSGKTTTLYAVLQILDRLTLNITTIEDPVEYRIEGINQIQVNPKTNLTFAEGLRSIVRQDPDVVLVGEIRDIETAEIAVNAALTGHLLLSTFHANDAATAIPRLLDMGVEPFLLASTLNIIIAQRLVRKICLYCRFSYTVSREDFQKIIPNATSLMYPTYLKTFYKGKGCKACNNTGYKGRISIFEIIEIHQELQDLILKNPSASQIWEVAAKHKSNRLFEDGLEKVLSGITTLEEVVRVAPAP
jgi:type II secretory ATPase GspE/PulE/Tfp pilus assembly ATPase PilB-like protein